MNDAQLVKVFNACYDLMEEFASLGLFDPLVLHNIVKELASTAELKNKYDKYTDAFQPSAARIWDIVFDQQEIGAVKMPKKY